MATPTSLPATFVAGNVLTAAQMNDLRGAFRILQVVSTTKTDAFTATSSSFVDVTGVSQAITPSSASNKVLVVVSGVIGCNANSSVRMNLVRDTTAIAQSTGSGTAEQTVSVYSGAANFGDSFSIVYLDSPATTSSTTYKIQVAALSTNTVVVGRLGVNGNYGSSTTITAMEVSA